MLLFLPLLSAPPFFVCHFGQFLGGCQFLKNLLIFCQNRNANSDILDLLTSSEEIPVELNEVFYKRFKNKNDVVHWAGEFKDYNIERLQKIKPIKGELPKLISNSMILSKITEMNLRFLNNNENINFYTITININYTKIDNIIEFRLPGSNIWYSRSRISLPEGPGCI